MPHRELSRFLHALPVQFMGSNSKNVVNHRPTPHIHNSSLRTSFVGTQDIESRRILNASHPNPVVVHHAVQFTPILARLWLRELEIALSPDWWTCDSSSAQAREDRLEHIFYKLGLLQDYFRRQYLATHFQDPETESIVDQAVPGPSSQQSSFDNPFPQAPTSHVAVLDNPNVGTEEFTHSSLESQFAEYSE